jgi:translation elongation factor EF-G
MFYSIDTVKSAFSQIKIMECTTGITSHEQEEINFTLYNGTIVAPLKATIEVYDLASRKIRHGISELNVSDLHGIYLVRVSVAKNFSTRKYSF